VGCGAREARLTQITIAPPNAQIVKGATLQLSATGIFDNGEKETLSEVTWETSQSDVAAINTKGEVSGAGEGVATVSAAYHGVTGSTSITVGPPTLVSITVSPNQASLPSGESEQLTATGKFTDGSTQDLTQSATWMSSGPAVASVSPTGAALAKTVGTATISATSGTVTGNASLAVTPAVVIAVNVIPAILSLPVGSGSQLQAMATLSDGTQQAVTSSVTWQTSQSAVATVNAQGYATAVGKGVAQLSAAYQGMAGGASITVGPPALVSITVSPNQASLPVGETDQLTATGKYTDGSTQNLTQSATWSSSGPTVASVSPAGAAVAKAVGTATISATSGSVTGNASFAVTPAAVVALNVVPETLSMPLGTSGPLQAMATMSDGTTQNMTATATWSSTQTAVATVNAQGVVTAAGKGAAQVSAAYQGLTGNASIAVGPPALVSIAVSPNQYSLPIDETEQFTATGTYTDKSTQNLTQTVTWSSSALTIATVSGTGSAVAKAVGTVTINATSGPVSGSASLMVSPAAIVALNIVPATVTMLLGSSNQLQAIATYSDGTTQNKTATVTWSSMQPSMVMVTSSGMTTAERVGSTTILAQSSGFTASADVAVVPLISVEYFNRANAKNSGYDSTIELINPGTIGGLCAMIYVFDSKQELNECCGCSISDSGLRTLSLLNDLTANTLTGKKPVAGTIEIVSSDPTQNPNCDPGSLTPTGQIAAWGTNVQASNGDFNVTEEAFATGALNSTQATVLATQCSMMEKLGSGQGICTCGTGD
jgi:uncharacterized protein YjdB